MGDWTSGRILPLILLIRTIGAIIEVYRTRENLEQDLGMALVDTRLHSLKISITYATENPLTHKGRAVEFLSKESRSLVVTLRADEQNTTESETVPRTVIFASKIFRVLTTMTHISLVIFSGLIFALNARTIGYFSAYYYLWILYVLTLQVVMLLITTGIVIPFSKVFISDL